MKKALVAFALVLVGLVVLLPFASSNPDGLQKIAEGFDVADSPIWQGLLPNYSVSALGNSYLSTLLSGIVGVTIVLAAALLLGKVMVRSSKTTKN